MKPMISITTLCLASLLPSIVNAVEGDRNSSLRGDYAFTGTATCLTSTAGFGPDFLAIAPYSSFSDSAEGVRRFNGDGTGTLVSSRNVSIGSGSGPVARQTHSADFTYSVAPDRSIHIDMGPFAATQIVGPRANTENATEVWRGIKLDGHVSQDFKTITIMTAAPDPRNPRLALEFGHYISGNRPDDTRACHRSQVMVRINGGTGRDD